MKYTQIPADTFEKIQLNAGILVNNFNPETGAISSRDIIGATTGGISFEATPSYTDFGEDIDNFPNNVKEMKKLDTWSAVMSGTFVTVSNTITKTLLAAADISGNAVIPRNDLDESDFNDVWWIGDYSDYNGDTNGGFVAIHLMNSLSTGGFKIKSSDKGKGQFAFEFTAHYSANDINTVPFEVYIKGGTAESGSYRMNVTSVAASTSGKTTITTSETAGSGQSYVYQTGYGLVVPHKGINLSGSAWTSWTSSSDIAATTGMDIVVAIIDSTTKESVHAGKTVVVAHE